MSNLPAETLGQIPILVYHNVHPARELGVTTVQPQVFRQHIETLLQEGFTPVTFQTVLNSPHIPPKPVVLTFDDGYANLMDYAVPVLQEWNIPAVVFMVTQFIGKRALWDVHFAGARYWHLSKEDLRYLLTQGWEIGSHTSTHRALTWLSARHMWQELSHSRLHLMETLGVTVDSIAYPFGLVNARVVQLASQAGYRIGTGSPFWACSVPHELTLPRLPVFPWYRSSHLLSLVNGHKPPWKRTITAIIRWPAVFTPIYQRLFRPFLWRLF